MNQLEKAFSYKRETKGRRGKEEKEGKTYTHSVMQHEATLPPISSGLSTCQDGRPPGKAGAGPKLTAALCLPVLRRNFPFLMDGQADKMCNL